MPLAALTVSGIINVFLNIFFVVAFKMTVDGWPAATVISNAFSAVLLMVSCAGPTQLSGLI